MTNWIEWFRYQLKASSDGFSWAFQQLNPAFLPLLPPVRHYMGLWSPMRLVWHVTEYEQYVAIPYMNQWLGGSMPADSAWDDSDEAWSTAQNRTPEEFISDFQIIQQAQLQLLDRLAAIDWVEPRQTIWGQKSLAWVVTKTYQHRTEHTDTLLRMHLRWQDALDDMARDGVKQSQT
jgi:hypothetical protein